MTDPEVRGGGWTIGRIIGLIIGLLGMGGFGFCSLCGLVLSSDSGGDVGVVLMFVVPGIGLTILFGLLVRTMIRGARKRPPP